MGCEEGSGYENLMARVRATKILSAPRVDFKQKTAFSAQRDIILETFQNMSRNKRWENLLGRVGGTHDIVQDKNMFLLFVFLLLLYF